MFDISTAILFGILFCACAVLCIVSVVLCIGALGRTHRIEKTLRDIECREIEIEIMQGKTLHELGVDIDTDCAKHAK